MRNVCEGADATPRRRSPQNEGGCAGTLASRPSQRSPSPASAAAAEDEPAAAARPHRLAAARPPPTTEPDARRSRRRPRAGEPDGSPGPAETRDRRPARRTRSSAPPRAPCARYIEALDARDGAAVCALLAPGALDGGRAARAAGSLRRLGRPPRSATATRAGCRSGRAPRSTSVRDRPRSAATRRRWSPTVVTRFADRDEASIEDDIIYLIRARRALARGQAELDPLPCSRDRRRPPVGALTPLTESPQDDARGSSRGDPRLKATAGSEKIAAVPRPKEPLSEPARRADRSRHRRSSAPPA